jgi:DNA-directed RNA polymerase subunit RPC12/RpoP
VKIKGTCLNCGREVLVQQILDSGGHCPWCGKAFHKDYTSIIVRALVQAEEAGDRFTDALEQLSEIEGLSLSLDVESLVGPVREALRAMRRHRVRV